MSYIRFDKDSDIYVWGDRTHYHLCVAGNRQLDNPHCNNMFECSESPKSEPGINFEQFTKWCDDTKEEYNAWLEKHVNFNYHPEAGKQYSFTTLEELSQKTIELKNNGLQIPGRFFERVNKEIKEQTKKVDIL